jgi:RNA polymerase sigma-70 factor (ECF subfamily)
MMLGGSALPRHGETEKDLVAAARNNDEAAIRSIIRTHNRMLFRMARSILPNEDEAEDAVQAAYARAFTGLAAFRGEARLGTWLGRIVINEALGRVRRERPTLSIDALETLHAAEVIPFPTASASPDPEQRMAQHQIRQILERAIDELPEPFRLVLVARLVEGMSVEDTAELLGLRPETVKTRLFRARALLRGSLEKRFGRVLQDAFPFGGERCQRIADRVIAALRNRQ